MLKNKIIALLSVATMMFSFATVVNAEKTPIVTDPTFAVKYNKDNGDGTHSYYFGVSFKESDPFTFKKIVINQDEVDSDGADPEYECSGIGLQCLEIILKQNDASDAITKVTGTKGISFTQANLKINFTATAASDFNKLTSRGDNIWTKFTVTTNKYVDPAAFECAQLTLSIKDAANFSNSWIYSSDEAMIEAKQADFLAYTAPAASDDEDEPTLDENPYVFSFTADQDTDVKITNSRTGDRTYDLPGFVKGPATVYGLLKITEGADVEAGDVFTIETVKNRVSTGTVKTITVE